MSALLRPDPRRGELIGAGAVALTIAVALLNFRFEDEWGVGVHFVYSALAAALVIALAALADPVPGGPPPRWHSALLALSFILLLLALANLADLLGSDGRLEGSGTVVWVGVLLIALMAWFSIRFDSGISTLLAALTFVVVLLSFVDWAFSPEESATFRWVLLAGAIALVAFAARGPDRGPHHTVGYVNAAGVALLGIALVYGLEGFGALFFGAGGSIDADTGWELVLLAGGFALIAYSVWAHQSGPAYLGLLNLTAFVLLAYGAAEDGPSLIGWPIVMLLLAAALLAAGLRRDVGPPPDRSPEAPAPAPHP